MAKNIVILGAGFGGLQAALTLDKLFNSDARWGRSPDRKRRGKHDLWEKYSVVLVDKNPFHTFTPLLYEIATTSPETASNLKLQELVSFPINSLISYRHITFINDELAGVDMDKKRVRLSRSEIDFEYLIVALGAEVNYFNIPGLAENSLQMKSFGDAIKIRDKITEVFRNSKQNVRIVIGGGGATGVELASEIKGWIPELRKECGSKCDTEITIVESNPSVLYSLDKRVSEKASRRLQKIGVSIVTNAKLSKMDEKGVYFTNGDKRDCDIVIWTGGVKANELTNNMPFKTEARGRIEADQNTNLGTNQENIFAIGDAAVIYHPHTNQPTPWTARPAIMEGRIAANNIFQKILAVEGIAKEPKQYCYRHRQYPYIIPIGGKYAVAKIGPFVISGIFGWAFKGITELNYFLSIMPPLQALKIWLKGFLIFIKNDRLG